MVRNITRVRRRMGDGEGVILRPFRGTPSESAWPRPDGWIRVAFPAGHGRRQKYARINRDRRDVVTGLRMMAATSMLGYGYTEEALRRGVDQGLDFIASDAGSMDPGPYSLGSRSDERRGGKECVSTCRFWGARAYKNKK